MGDKGKKNVTKKQKQTMNKKQAPSNTPASVVIPTVKETKQPVTPVAPVTNTKKNGKK